MQKNIIRFLIEILIIFIGITLSFFFEEYRESRKTAQQMKEMVASLLSDAESKEKELDEDVKNVRYTFEVIDTCLALSNQGIQIPGNLIDEFIWSISYDYGDFATTTATYESLKSSALWSNLPDTLRKQIYFLHAGSYGYVHNSLMKSYDYVSDLKKHFFSILQLNFFNTGRHRFQSREVDHVAQMNMALKNKEFRSAILVIRNQRVKVVDFYSLAIVDQKKATKNIKKYLESL